MVRTAWREKKGGVFETENVKNEDLELHDFTANRVTFPFPNKKKSTVSIPLLTPHARKKKEVLRNVLGPGRIFENSGKIRVFVILNLSTPVLDERVIMSSICLATMYDDSNKFILNLRCTNGYIRDIRL